MLFEINEEVREYIRKEKDFLKPSVILNLVRDTIQEMLSYNIPKKAVLDKINKELGTNINYYTFVSFVRKLKTTQSYQKQITKTNNKDNKPKKTSFTDPFQMLKGIN